jgi:hypothetical protein
MKVGDLVQISVDAIMSGEGQESVEGSGVIIGKRYANRGFHIMKVLWDDGVIEETHENDLVVINENN